MEFFDGHRLVAERGDVRSVSVSDLRDVDGVVAGPPCPPWAGNGLRRWASDERHETFGIAISWISAWVLPRFVTEHS